MKGHPLPAPRQLASLLLAREAASCRTTAELVEATERVYQQLLAFLADLMSTVACRALMSHALKLASAEWPVLVGISPAEGSPGLLPGLSNRIAGLDGATTFAIVLAILTHFIATLYGLFGPQLGLLLVRRAFPELRLVDGEEQSG